RTCAPPSVLVEERAELGGCFEVRDRIESLECRRERVRERKHGPRRKFLVLRFEVLLVNVARQVAWHVEGAFDESAVDGELRKVIRNLGGAPGLDLLLHWFEVPLHTFHADGD